MNKETFLDLAGKLFDQTNSEVETLIPLDKDTYAEIVDQISSELFDEGVGLVEDYDLGICGREIELESIEFNLRRVEETIKDVLKRYFEIK